jgi:hypothetical protein
MPSSGGALWPPILLSPIGRGREKPVCSLPAHQERSVPAPVAAGLCAGRLKLVHKGASLIQTRLLVPYRLSEELWEFDGGLFPIVIPVKTGIQDHPCFRTKPAFSAGVDPVLQRGDENRTARSVAIGISSNFRPAGTPAATGARGLAWRHRGASNMLFCRVRGVARCHDVFISP